MTALAKALGGRRGGTTWMARCPAHEDRQPSLSIGSAEMAGCSCAASVARAARAGGQWLTRDQKKGPGRRCRNSSAQAEMWNVAVSILHRNREQLEKGEKAMNDTSNSVDRAPNASDDASMSHRKLTTTDPITTEFD